MENHQISKFKLSGIIFFLFISLGTVGPIFSLYMKEILGFEPTQIGLILSLAAISSLVTPVLGAIFADRLISSEKLFAILIGIAGLALLIMPSIKTYEYFLPVYGVYALMLGPAMSLMNTIIFHHVKGGSKNYGFIRVWGTIGWIFASWIFGYFWLKTGDINSKLFTAFYFSGVINLISASVVFFIPSTLDFVKRKIELFPRQSLAVIKNKDVLMLCFIIFLGYFTDAFYTFGTTPFLKSIGIADHKIMPMMGVGQFLEIPMMFILAKFISKLGIKKVIVLGIISNILRYFFIMNSSSVFFLCLGIFFHGPAYAFVFSTAYIYLDKFSNKENRAGVQQYYAILTSGIGGFLGNNVAGFVAKISATNGVINYNSFWFVPFLVAILTLVVVLLFFKIKDDTQV